MMEYEAGYVEHSIMTFLNCRYHHTNYVKLVNTCAAPYVMRGVQRAGELSSYFPKAHGDPVATDNPYSLGIGDLK